MIEIKYNNINAFDGICPTPFVEFSKESDGWWSSSKTFKLSGQISCCGLSLNQVLEKQENLIRNFFKNFKKFQIIETDTNETLVDCDYAYIKSINFEESDYAYFLPFQIEIQAHEKDAFEGNAFVTNPVAEYSINEEANGLINYKFVASAKGLDSNTNISPIQRAKNWVNNIVQWNNFGDPSFSIPGLIKTRIECDPDNPGAIIYQTDNNGNILTHSGALIVSEEESYNRSESTYSRTINFIVDPKSTVNGTTMTYRVKIDKQKNEFLNIVISGEIKGKTIEDARARLNLEELYSIAASYSAGIENDNITNLVKNFDITESLDKKTISFSYAYNNENSLDGYIKANISYNSASLSSEDSKNSINIDITAVGTKGTKEQRFLKAKELIESTSPEIEISILSDVNNIDINNFELISTKYTENESDGLVNIKYEYKNKSSISYSRPCSVKSLDGSIEEELPCQQYNFKRALCEDWVAIPTFVSNKIKRMNLNLVYSSADKKQEAMNYVQSIVEKEAIGTQIRAVINENPENSEVLYEYEWEEILTQLPT